MSSRDQQSYGLRDEVVPEPVPVRDRMLQDRMLQDRLPDGSRQNSLWLGLYESSK